MEGDVVEADAAVGDADRPGAGHILDAERLELEVDQFLHVVDRALQIADVGADIAQIALQHEERGQHEGDIAGARLPPRPQKQRKSDHRCSQKQQHRSLRGAAHPGAARAGAPSGDDLGEACFLAFLGAKALDHGVAAHRIGQRAAKARVPCIGKPCRGRDIAKRQQRRHRDEQHRACGDDSTHQRPEPAEQQRRADEHDDGRQQRDQDRVVEQVERPHATGYLAHGRSGEAVGVPVGGETLDAVEGVGGDIRHHLQGQFDDGHEGEVAQHDTGERQRHQHRRRPPSPRSRRRRRPQHCWRPRRPAGRNRAASARRPRSTAGMCP